MLAALQPTEYVTSAIPPREPRAGILHGEERRLSIHREDRERETQGEGEPPRGAGGQAGSGKAPWCRGAGWKREDARRQGGKRQGAGRQGGKLLNGEAVGWEAVKR